jgi:aryl-alcohol dehydrogenase-like predicted oxidoreductase
MRYRAFGRVGLDVSEISFGCGPTAGLLIEGDPNEHRRTVERALQLGINYFDTAAAYGRGRSEENLGRALTELAAKPVIATKVTLEWSDLEDIPGAVEKSVAGSLARLRSERLDVVHLHNRVGAARAARSIYGSGALLTVSDVLGEQGVVETLLRLQADGRVGVIGCCAFGGERESVAELVDSDAFSSVLVNYSLLNPTALNPAQVTGRQEYGRQDYHGIGARAAARGMAVIALRVLEGGALVAAPSSRSPHKPQHMADSRRPAAVESLGALIEPEEDLTSLAVRFAISNPQVATVVVGFSDTEQVEQACENATRGSLAPEVLARIEQLRASGFSQGD